MEIINGSTCYRVSCLSTTRESFGMRIVGMLIDVTPTIADKLLNTVYSSVKAVALLRFKVGTQYVWANSRRSLRKITRQIESRRCLELSKYKKLILTYLLEDYHGKSVAGGFYEYELHRVANLNVYLVEKVLRKKGDKVKVK